MKRTIVIVLCGIPGAGKTTFAQHLRSWFQERMETNCSVVSFDDFVPNQSSWDEDTFHVARRKGLEETRNRLNCEGCESSEIRKQVIIVDDNMYLHSMRREVYVLARDAGAILVVVHVNTNAQAAKLRNDTRDENSRVETRAFDTIFTRFEPPSASHIADRNFIEINCEDVSINVDRCVQCINSIFNDWDSFQKLATNEITSVAKKNTAVLSDKSIFISNADERLRKEVSKLIQLFSKSVELVLSAALLPTSSLECDTDTNAATIVAAGGVATVVEFNADCDVLAPVDINSLKRLLLSSASKKLMKLKVDLMNEFRQLDSSDLESLLLLDTKENKNFLLLKRFLTTFPLIVRESTELSGLFKPKDRCGICADVCSVIESKLMNCFQNEISASGN